MSLKYDYGNVFADGSIKGFGEEFDSVAKADFMAAGVLEALKRSMTEGGAYEVIGSLTRGGYWLHQCTDLCEKPDSDSVYNHCSVGTGMQIPQWKKLWCEIPDTAVGTVLFPMPATYQAGAVEPYGNMRFSHGENDFPNP